MFSANETTDQIAAGQAAQRPWTPELLVPAGNERALVAAVQSGADAVYLGLREFSARRGADNFTMDELAEAVRYAHLRGARVYLTLNVLALPDELPKTLILAAAAREAGVDAFIVQDLGLAGLLARHLPDVALHASTQMSTHTPDGIAVLDRLGFGRVTLARELTLGEVASCAAGPVPVEVFIHGALCYCYSGQCLLSSMVGGRSGNRGLCVQACRLAYELADDRVGPIEAGGDYPLSTKDLCGVNLIPKLAVAGVAALKIEGRLKSAEYVATVVDVYRRALDRWAADPETFAVSDEDRHALEEAFSRGFTEGYLSGIRDHRMMSVARPSDRGVPIGRVVRCDVAARTCVIKLTRGLAVGDEIEIWVRKGGRVAQKIDRLEVEGEKFDEARAGQTVTVGVSRPAGFEDRVFRTANARLLEAARERLRPSGAARLVPIDVTAELRVGEQLLLQAVAEDGAEVEVAAARVEPARTKPLDKAIVGEHLGRLGGSAYSARRIDVTIDKDCFLPLSEINKARQVLIDRLDSARLAPWRREERRVRYDRRSAAPRAPCRPVLAASADVPETALELAETGLDWLYFDPSFERGWDSLARRLESVSEAVRSRGGRLALLLPPIVREREMSEFDDLIGRLGGALDGVVVGHAGQTARFSSRVSTVIGSSALNVANAESVEAVSSLGADRVTLSLELTGAQIMEIAAQTSVPLEVVVFGSLQVMIAENCLYALPGGCGDCTGRTGFVRDAKDFVFPVRVDRACHTRIFNPFDLSVVKQLPELSGAGIDAVRLELGGHGPGRAAEIVGDARKVLALLPDQRESAAEMALELSNRLSSQARFTTGHYFRPVK